LRTLWAFLILLQASSASFKLSTLGAGLPDLPFAKGPNLAQKQPERSQNLRQGAKKLSAVTKSNVLSNSSNGNVPQSLL